jgi:uncharacterized membrane protein
VTADPAGAGGAAAGIPMGRREYLDWLRGIAVLIMIEAHTLDSWTRVEDRNLPEFGWALLIGGFGAPIFLFLAGVALALAAGSRLRKGRTDAEAAALARRRAWQIFGLAFLFRLQSVLISGGSLESLLKVDILNVMGVSMLAAALLWGAGRDRWSRAALLVAGAVAVAMVTPLIRATPLLEPLPDRLEWYFRPAAGRTTFTLFPWGGFLLAGAAIGIWLDAARTLQQERRIIAALSVVGPALALAGYAASLLPPIYAQTNFWTSSPTFFFLRVGVLVSLVPIAFAWNAAFRGRSPIREFGLASLFVYWIHVEMVYGVVSRRLHKQLPFGWAIGAFAAFSVFLFGLVKLKDYLVRTRPYRSSWQSQPGSA